MNKWIGYALAALVFIAACGKGVHTNTGAVTFSLKFSDNVNVRAQHAVPLQRVDCSASGISTIEATVYDGNGAAIATGGPWSCDAHEGTISNIPAGSNYWVIVTAKDGSGNAIYSGEKTSVTVTAGQTIDIGEITLEAVVQSETPATTQEGMVFVPGGCFDMGDNFGDGFSNELPVHRVCLDDFYMDKTEVTQSAYQSVMGNNPSYFTSCGGDCPVEQVSWYDADDYCSRVGKRLPTEAEWEYAAREGGRVVRYGTGSDSISSSDENYNKNINSTVSVGSYSPNALGLYNMAGNVWEWVYDWLDTNYYSYSPVNNPQGPSSSGNRVMRGGSWKHAPIYVRASSRYWGLPSKRYYLFGIRCAQ